MARERVAKEGRLGDLAEFAKDQIKASNVTFQVEDCTLDVGFATQTCQPQLEPPGTGDERAALRPQSGQGVHCGLVDLHDFREIEHGDAAVRGIEQDLDGVAGQ